MGTAARLSSYLAALALVFAVAWWTGTLVDRPSGPPAEVAGAQSTSHGHAGDTPTGDTHGIESAGLVTTAAGYMLVPRGPTTFLPGVPGELAFAVTGSDGRPVTTFDVVHERPLHLIVVRRDGAGFQHLHPALGPDGVWRVPLTLPVAGVYRAYADFAPTGGPALVLGTDLFAPGEFVPGEFPPSRTADVAGYQVRLDGDLTAGGASQVVISVSRDGVPVTDLEPYLGAFGHLVVLRQGDLTYLHVHPEGAAPAPTDRAGPGVTFTAEIPTAGGYRLFFDFQHGGAVRTAEFTVTTGGGQ